MISLSGIQLSIADRNLFEGDGFILEKGKFSYLVGESGSGKTLFAKSLLGLEPATAKLNYLVASGPDPRESVESFFYIPQVPSAALNPALKVSDHFKILAKLTDSQQITKRLEQVGLTDVLNSYPSSLSGGQQQRLLIALAIYLQPKFLVVDEPTSALDPANKELIISLMKEVVSVSGGYGLFITHDEQLVEHSSPAFRLREGKLFDFEKQELRAKRHLSKTALGEPVIELKSVHKSYSKNVVLNDFTLTVKAGEVVCLQGESGSGKSTLLSVLAGVIDPDSGEMRTSPNLEIALISQDPVSAFASEVLIRDAVIEHAVFGRRKLDPELALENAYDLAQRIGLDHHLFERRPRELSGGQLQRFSIIRAVLTTPGLILADEPTSALDQISSNLVLNTLLELSDSIEATLIISTHDQKIAEQFSSRIIRLSKLQ